MRRTYEPSSVTVQWASAMWLNSWKTKTACALGSVLHALRPLYLTQQSWSSKKSIQFTWVLIVSSSLPSLTWRWIKMQLVDLILKKKVNLLLVLVVRIFPALSPYISLESIGSLQSAKFNPSLDSCVLWSLLDTQLASFSLFLTSFLTRLSKPILKIHLSQMRKSLSLFLRLVSAWLLQMPHSGSKLWKLFKTLSGIHSVARLMLCLIFQP